MTQSDSLITDRPVVSSQATPQDNQDNTSPHAEKKRRRKPKQGLDTKTDS
jgi:hypothetical protein